MATGPRPTSNFASITVPSAKRLGLDLSSKISDCNTIFSIRLSTPLPVEAETSTSSTSPDIDSTTTSYLSNSVLTLLGSEFSLSHLLIATIIGTFAAFAWLIASIVCGITPSSAATTRIIMSVTCAPLDLMDVKAA